MSDTFFTSLGSRFAKPKRARRWASPLQMAHELEGLEMPPHQRLVDAELVELADADPGDRDRLAVSEPPQHGKSLDVSIWFPIWLLHTNPELRIAIVSYNEHYAMNNLGVPTRDLIRKHKDDLGFVISRDNDSKSLFRIANHGGGIMYLGVGGGLGGWSLDYLIIDDLIKNHEDGFNPEAHERNWLWHQAVAKQRLQHGVKEVIAMTRWSELDIIGKVTQAEPKRWRVIALPAKAEDDDPLGRARGEGLWLTKNPQSWYDEEEKSTPPFIWAGLYQQRPAPEEGGIFKKAHFRYFNVIDGSETQDGRERWLLSTGEIVDLDACTRFGMADTATSTKTSADWTAVGAFAVTPMGDLLVYDMIRVRVDEEGLAQTLLQFRMRARLPWIGVESNFSTTGLALQLGTMAPGVFRTIAADADKLTRALPLRTRLEMHRIHFLAGQSWLPLLEHEMLTFTGQSTGTHDDMVDVLAYAARHLDTTAAGSLRARHKKVRKIQTWRQVGT